MWLQHITVLEPDDDMIECAIAAFAEVMPEEEREMYVEKADNEIGSEDNEEAGADSGAVSAQADAEEARAEDTAENASPEMTDDGSEE